jgi:hypothetical protein
MRLKGSCPTKIAQNKIGHLNAVVFKDEGVPIAVLMAYEDYLELLKNVGEE